MGETKKILVAGASGDLGTEIVKLLKKQGYELRLITRSDDGLRKLSSYSDDIWKVNATEDLQGLNGIGEGVNYFISTLGKSLSLFRPNEDKFITTDFIANRNILNALKTSNVKRVLYVSIKGADAAQEFEIAKAHKLFEEEIEASGISHTIIRPVGLFSGLNDLTIMAKRQIIPIVGDGNAKTNSIYNADLADVIVSFLDKGPNYFEPGGPLIHTRLEMAEMIQNKIGGKIIRIPEAMADLGMLLPDFLDNGLDEKLDFYKYVTTRDMIGEKCGSKTYEEYLNDLNLNDLP
ncbi:NAD(P)H-binding protein [Christiangramia echinicola]|uniref:Uncharacterized conserved protein YbjT, contains NAD(P)-binding and DUF2867 domains n=1 Tax=Christiangramia echinicola TaxID=279359 RepID=A0A1H1RGG7_9FLAO|nr:NAD(P)H-binding protein [Christiangramia echinicola]SDS34844.1 Uncharacterized conserved protein YbjT, contains NAD(P)-binding and DUF2867 domains [Christiangramia echinicola]